MTLTKASFVIVEASRLATEGKHDEEICAHLGISRATLINWKRRFGISTERKPPTPKEQRLWQPDERAQRMASMYRQGLTLEKIGEHFGVTRERVRQLIARQGIDRTGGGQSVLRRAKENARKAARNARSLAAYGLDYDEMREHRRNGLTSAFKSQRGAAKLRGIQWELTFSQWLSVWQESGKLAQRGRGKGRYVMSRIKDEGGYVVGNVHIQLSTENNSQGIKKIQAEKRKAANSGVWCIYPNSSRPWIAKAGKKYLGTFATEEEAVAVRAAYLQAHPFEFPGGKLGRGRGYAIRRRGDRVFYEVYVASKYVGCFSTPEAAVEARNAYVAQALARRVESRNPTVSLSAVHGTDSPFFAAN